MRFFQKTRRFGQRRNHASQAFADNDPLTGLANLFDLGLVFIVGLLLMVFSAFHLQDLFDQDSNFTMVRQTDSGEMEIVTKRGRKIEAVRVTRTEAEGRGVRLGTAYRLEDGSMVYVPGD